MADNHKKQITIDDLAVMVAEGFEHVENEIGGLKQDVGSLKQDVGEMNHQMQALNSNVNNYLELSEKRYSELKQRDALLAKWLKLIADKAGVPIDVSQLEKI